jgi:hypothetical protein
MLCFVVTGSTANALDIETDVQPPPGEVGTPYEFEFEGQEGCVPYRFSYLNGTVPPGLAITTDGKLTGTPTQAGTFSFWVGLDDNGEDPKTACPYPSAQSQGQFTMIVLPDLAVSTTSLPTATSGRPYSVQLEYTNPEAGWPVVWDITAGSMPTGLTLSESGLISGTPVAPDVKTFVVRAREPFRRFGERELTLRVSAALQGARTSMPARYACATQGRSSPPAVRLRARTASRADAFRPASRSTPRRASCEAHLRRTDFHAHVRGYRFSRATHHRPGGLRIASQLSIKTTRLLRNDPRPLSCTPRIRRRPRADAVARRPQAAAARDPARCNHWSALRHGSVAGVSRCTFEVRDRLGARSTKAFRLSVAS